MRLLTIIAVAVGLIICVPQPSRSQTAKRPYRLSSVDLKRRVIWGAEYRLADGAGLAFGGQDQDAEDGRPHTRILVNGEWQSIGHQLRANNPLQAFHQESRHLRDQAKSLLARLRSTYFKGLSPSDESRWIAQEALGERTRLVDSVKSFASKLPRSAKDDYVRDQIRHAGEHLKRAAMLTPTLDGSIDAAALTAMLQMQIQLELAAEALDAEPPARAMNCGAARLPKRQLGATGKTLVYDATTNLYVIFGGDHLDYLTNDTWVFDPSKRRWMQRHPDGAPTPRANHRLAAMGDGTIRMTGGYTYTSSTDYLGGQYIDLDDGEWIYDIHKNEWRGGKLVASDTRIYRSGPFHPAFYTQGSKPDAASFEAFLKTIPTNEWVATNPPHLPRLNRDWGTARIDPARDMILRWSGGHSAHGGTDVLHYHFSTNRWELPFPVEFPLGQLYTNTSYPNGFNFNLRPWMTGHTYQNYDYDPVSKLMIKAGRPRHFYVYDPDRADWISRGSKPSAMQYNSCFYTLTLASTPHGVMCWDKHGRVHRYEHGSGGWVELKLKGDRLPGAYVDNSSMVYDSSRDRLLVVNTPGYGKPYNGEVWSVNLKTNLVKGLSPTGRQFADRFANVDKSCYDAAHDLLLMGTHLKGTGAHTPMSAYDCVNNRWITLNIRYKTEIRLNRVRRKFPNERSDGMMYDPRRRLIWGTDTNSQVYVLRLDMKQVHKKPLGPKGN